MTSLIEGLIEGPVGGLVEGLTATGLTPGDLLAVAAIYIIGGMVKGALGFGLPLVTISMLPFLMSVETALAINAVALIAINGLQVARAGGARAAVRRAAPLMAGLLAATPVAAAIRTAAPPELVMIAVGLFVIAFSAIEAFGARGDGRPATGLRGGPAGGAAVGAVAGLVAAFTSAPGAVFVAHFAGLRLARPAFMATIGVLMIVSGAALAASLAVSGALDGPRAALGLACVAPASLGFLLGDAAGRRLPTESFRRLVLLGLCILGVGLILRAI